MLGQLLNQPSLPAMQHVSHDLRVAGFARDFNSVDALRCLTNDPMSAIAVPFDSQPNR
jgi:hypothetical protein